MGRSIVKGSPTRLKEIRLALGLTQYELAPLLGVPRNTLARWERGDIVPPKVAEMAAEYLLLTHQPKGEGE